MIALRLFVSLFCALALLSPLAARAETTAGQRQAAAEAYDRGTAEYLAGEYGPAAEWFETAHRLAPAAPALMQAIRAHLKAGNEADAATLALRLTQEYPDEGRAVEYGTSIVYKLAPSLLKVEVQCDECGVALDGMVLGARTFFVPPDTEHRVTASFEGGDVHEEMNGGPGETRTWRPEAPPPPELRADAGTELGLGDASDDGGGGLRLSPLYTYIGAGVTGALLAGLVYSEVTLSKRNEAWVDARDAYNTCGSCAESAQLFEIAKDKRSTALDRQALRNALAISTGVAAVGTTVLALLFTDWSGERRAEDELTIRVIRVQDGGLASLGGRF